MPATTTTTSRESAMLTDVTLSQIPELSEFVDDDNDANTNDNLLADDSEFDLLRRDCERGHATSFTSEHADQSSTEHNHTDTRLDFETCTQPISTRQPQTQIPRIRAGALDTVTNTRVYESQRKVGGIDGKLASYSQRPPSLPKPVFPTHSTISDESLPRHRSSTPEPSVLITAEPDQAAIPPVSSSAHIPIQTHPDVPSPSPPPEQPPQGSPKNVENDEQEEIEVADITITIADADSDSDSHLAASKWADNANVDSNSMLTHSYQGEHVKPVFSPMRRGMKRSIDLDEAADDGIGERDGEADEQAYGDMVMDDSDAEMETDLHMSAKERDGHTKKDVQTKGGRTRTLQDGKTKNRQGHPLRKNDKVPESTSTRTLPAKRTKYVPRIRSGAGGGKTIGTSHLTQLREAHRRLGIAKSERAVVPNASGSGVGKTVSISTFERRVGVHPSSRSVSGSLHQKHTQPVLVKEIGPSRATSSVLAKEREKKPWVDVRTTEAADSRSCGATLAVHLTKPVPFTFRADARARRVVTDPCISGLGLNDGGGGGSSGAGEKDKGKNRADGGLKKLMLLESDHGEAWLHRREERVPSSLASSSGTSTGAATISTTVPRPFTFTTALRANERAKFDALIHQKQEETARVREEARKQAEEEMARVVREMRRRAVPKAHEVPEWYKEMPKKGQGMG
ncbi:hypothetical protein EDD15DRAFT_1912305 [Pisolithus albus]|nr:hypothetical protein EDD15DRAFT_1912305 [Pisolithus albus]